MSNDRTTPIRSSEMTDEAVWKNRRKLITAAGLGVAAAAVPGLTGQLLAQPVQAAGTDLPHQKSSWKLNEKLTSFEDATNYNNYYEFGFGKADPARHAGALRLDPWSIRVDGEVAKPKTFALEDLMKLQAMEERVYRFRCVEAWSMVLPWLGYSLSHLLKEVEPTSRAKYVEFITAVQPDTMPGVRTPALNWPYREVARIDEAMHPLTLLAFGLYGKTLLPQSGAPLRIVFPWKYGFKSAKSLVGIRLHEKMPRSTWMEAVPNEYGFYANVNPQVSHPRWSQASERRIGDGLFASRRATLMFNGYADQVAHLYTGLDLAKNF